MIKKLLYSSLFILMTTGITHASDNKEEIEKVIRGECVDIKDERVIATINILEKYTANEALRNPFENINNIACFFKEFDINNYRAIGYPKIIIDIPKAENKNYINEKTFNEDMASSLNLESEYIQGLLDKSNQKSSMKSSDLKNVEPRIKPNVEKFKKEPEVLIPNETIKELDLKDNNTPNEKMISLNNENIKDNIKDNYSLKTVIELIKSEN